MLVIETSLHYDARLEKHKIMKSYIFLKLYKNICHTYGTW